MDWTGWPVDRPPTAVRLGCNRWDLAIALGGASIGNVLPSQADTASRAGAYLRKLHELATRLEQEAKGKVRQLAERLRLKRDS